MPLPQRSAMRHAAVMIDDPEQSPRRRSPVEPVWGDPLASHGTLSDPSAVPGDVRAAVRASVWGTDPLEDGVPAGAFGAPVPLGTPDGMQDRTGVGRGLDGGRRPLLMAVLRPWFEPRPGELRGAIVLLAVSLAVSLALWFDAARRPSLDGPPIGDDAVRSVNPASAPAGLVAGSADGSDGWGMGGGADVPIGPVVHVSGAVRIPGVVTLPEGSRVADAVAASGGAMPDARLDRLNLARRVDDGERIHVPRVGEDAPPPDEPASRGVLADGRIDLNAASQAELETLPGVGPARAQAIILERETRPYRVPGDLRRVPGIGEATFQRLAPLVAVR